MRARGRLVLGAAVVFAVAMGALESGGWWWAWLAAATAVVLARGVRLPFLCVRLNPTSRYILAENRKPDVITANSPGANAAHTGNNAVSRDDKNDDTHQRGSRLQVRQF